MTTLVWDGVGTRVFETGVDRGVLYLPDGSAIPWNGLTAIVEKPDVSTTAVYFDGQKIQDLVVLGDFSATMKAITYPDEFLELEGSVELQPGAYIEDQPMQVFALCYRTLIGDDVDGLDAGHKLHIVYNLTAEPSDRSYETITDSTELMEFEWEITATPEEYPGYRPSAHVVIDSRKVDPDLLAELEAFLYGDETVDAALPELGVLLAHIADFYDMLIIVEDIGDGTWTAKVRDPDDLEFDVGEPTMFTLYHANATYLDADTYLLRNTVSYDEL